jgi:hypothetical protein
MGIEFPPIWNVIIGIIVTIITEQHTTIVIFMANTSSNSLKESLHCLSEVELFVGFFKAVSFH